MSNPTFQGLQDQIQRTAVSFLLPPEIVLAICKVESGLNPHAYRHEPAYPWLWDCAKNAPLPVSAAVAGRRSPPPEFRAPAGISALSEWVGQQSSWGLMQVMGAVAREYGFRGHFPQLCFPTDGLALGCRHLAQFQKRFGSGYGWAGAVSAYNCGQPKLDNPYIAKVAKAGAAAFLPGY